MNINLKIIIGILLLIIYTKAVINISQKIMLKKMLIVEKITGTKLDKLYEEIGKEGNDKNEHSK